MRTSTIRLSILLTLVAALALSAPAFAKGSNPALLAPTNVAALEDCLSLDVSWDPVTGANKYSIEVTAEYDSLSTDCSNPPDTTIVSSFGSTTTSISIDYSNFLVDFGNGPQLPCDFSLVRVKGLNPPGKGSASQNNPFGSATPSFNCI